MTVFASCHTGQRDGGLKAATAAEEIRVSARNSLSVLTRQTERMNSSNSSCGGIIAGKWNVSEQVDNMLSAKQDMPADLG